MLKMFPSVSYRIILSSFSLVPFQPRKTRLWKGSNVFAFALIPPAALGSDTERTVCTEYLNIKHFSSGLSSSLSVDCLKCNRVNRLRALPAYCPLLKKCLDILAVLSQPKLGKHRSCPESWKQLVQLWYTVCVKIKPTSPSPSHYVWDNWFN